LEDETGGPIVKAADAHSLESHILALKAGVLSNEAFIENPDDEFHEWIVRGRPTERALLVAGTHAGLSKKMLEEEFPLVERVPFSSASKFSASLHKNERGGTSLYVLGAPEVLEARAVNFHVDGKVEPLNSVAHTKLRQKLDELTSTGLRVMACAHREFEAGHTFSGPLVDSVEGLTLVGYIALKDPLRTDALDSIALTKRAGIRTVLITGDHRLTALSIAREVGIDATEDTVLEGLELERMSDEELLERAKTISIYARVSPHHKLRIVEALQKHREVVAMIGDGVNDAPALKAADVGVAVGSGTDVAKEVADMVLLDDNFKTIVKAIEQGRVSFQNIRKVFVYLVADDFSELALFLFALSIGLPLPLVAAQILWINLVEDGLPDIALTTEQETAGVMDEKPRDPNESILNTPVKLWMTAIFFISGSAAILSFMLMLRATGDVEIARTFVFTLMCLDSLALAFSVRSFRHSVLRRDIFSNRLLVGAVCISFTLLLLALYTPWLQTLLSTVPLSLHAWFLAFAVMAIEMVLIEWSKKALFGRAPVSVG
jgi:Ca2+-transporting ATPase